MLIGAGPVLVARGSFVIRRADEREAINLVVSLTLSSLSLAFLLPVLLLL